VSAPTVLERETAFVLEPLGEFSLRAAARFWGGFTPASHPGLDAEGHLHMAIAVEGSWASAGVCVREVDGDLVGRAYGDVTAEPVQRQTARILSLDVDGRAFAEVGRRDPVAAELQQRFVGLRPVCFYSAYEAAAWAIISQRIHHQQAAAVKARLAEALGELVSIHGQPIRAFPGPHVLARLQEFAGLFGSKVANLRALANAALAGELDSAYLRSLPDAQALALLQALPGIGPFSSQLILLRGAGHPDFLTLMEPRFRRAVTRAYALDDEASDEDLQRISAAWRPYRMWMTFLLRQEYERAPDASAR
jgi:DNA-3-methyladenine glycosylase II